MRRVLFGLILLMAACDPYAVGPLEDVEVVVVRCEQRKGSADCVTIVEFPDGTRRLRVGQWGYEGETFKASKRLGSNVRTRWDSDGESPDE